ncbi:lytic transglycosylase domain-containing protein [Ramlibacter sp. H39-3-26]|uniref:lytic transglycosylase domain-containing protein n=1 Tax=Curvibacter soli TaxID=3031331 RepID=UPI0031F40A6F
MGHFAAERMDERYVLFFRGNDFDSARDLPEAATPRAVAVPAGGSKLLAFFDVSPGYKRVKRTLREASQRNDVDVELLQALIATESGFDPGAISPKGAVGLMQVMPATARRWGVTGDARASVEKKLADPATNIAAGVRYLRYLIDLFPGELELALAAYNAGEGAVQRAGNRIPDFKETRDYVKTVMQLYEQLKPPPAVASLRRMPARVRMELPAGAD